MEVLYGFIDIIGINFMCNIDLGTGDSFASSGNIYRIIW